MVAKVKTGKSINNIFNYNENKVKENVAECIGAVNYPKDLDQLTFSQRLHRLTNQASLHPTLQHKAVHISLNFSPDERLDKETLNKIAESYMEKIGFGNQPYLVYQHHDAGHPHIHIVSTKVKPDGSNIDTHYIAVKKSEAARKQIEKDFGLVKAEDQKRLRAYLPKAIDAGVVNYGRTPTKRAMSNVLDSVLKTYRYTSLPELNALLSLYNIQADRGSEDSRTFQKNGLYYRLLDADGQKVGVPIKASDFHDSPTLKFLQKQFAVNIALREKGKRGLTNIIQFELARKPKNLSDLISSLQRQGVHTILRRGKTGEIYGITYIDHGSKCIFNGSALGKPFSAKAVLEACGEKQSQNRSQKVSPTEIHHPGKEGRAVPPMFAQPTLQQDPILPSDPLGGLIDVLLQTEYTDPNLPYPLRPKKRRKRRRRKL